MLPKTICGMFDIPPWETLNQFQDQGFWVLDPVEMGTDRSSFGGRDYSALANAGIGVIARAQARYGADGGSLPPLSQALDFATRVANYCAASPGLAVLHIGNEFQHSTEWWDHVPRPPEEAGAICAEVYLSVKMVRPDLLVGMGAIAPWNVEYEGMDWLEYQRRTYETFRAVVGHGPDINVVHTYTHGQNPDLVDSGEKMNVPYQDRFYHFRAFEQTLEALPEWARGVDVMIAEMDQNMAWADVNQGWMKRAYARVNEWNQTHADKILCALPFRWLGSDKYGLEGRQNVLQDLREAYQVGYTWVEEEQPMSWRTVYQSSFEEGSYDYQGVGELTCPIGWTPAWKEGTGEKRPEYDMKSTAAGHPEIHTGAWAANFFMMSSKMRACLYKTFALTPGHLFRASIWGMGIANANVGASAEGAGVRLVADPDGGSEWERDDTPHSDWWSNYGANVGSFNNKWVQLSCQGTVGATGQLRLFLVGHADYALKGVHLHWDDVKLEVEDGTVPEPPVSGEHKVTVLLDGVDIGDLPFGVEAEVVVGNVKFKK